MAKYKVGDRVRIVSERTSTMNREGLMDKHLDTVMTISRIRAGGDYCMEEDGGEWYWNDAMIKGLEELEPPEPDTLYKVGDKVLIKTKEEMPEDAPFGFSDGMIEYFGKVVTITSARFSEGWKADCYRMYEDCNKWSWGNDMIKCKVPERSPRESPREYEVGDKVLLKTREEMPVRPRIVVTSIMERHCGKVMTVASAEHLGAGRSTYTFIEDGGFFWSEDTIECLVVDVEPVEDPTPDKFKELFGFE